MNALRIERLIRQQDFERCVAIQYETWHYSESELFPKRAFLLAERIGGHVLGAFDGEELVAFNLAYPGLRRGRPYLHSQMLAVLPAYRNAGAGRAMKLMQREIALSEGINLIRWTFDPLEIKNAFFNIEQLGAVCREYVRDFYGPSSSPLQGGLPTDRLYADWWVGSAHVRAQLEGSATLAKSSACEKVCISAEIYAWKATQDERAAAEQQRVRAALEAAFERGLIVSGFARNADGSGCYCLSATEPGETS